MQHNWNLEDKVDTLPLGLDYCNEEILVVEYSIAVTDEYHTVLYQLFALIHTATFSYSRFCTLVSLSLVINKFGERDEM